MHDGWKQEPVESGPLPHSQDHQSMSTWREGGVMRKREEEEGRIGVSQVEADSVKWSWTERVGGEQGMG